MLLELKDVSIQFGGLKVIEGMSLQMKAGELVALIGPNGAGKTTAFNLISGIYKPTRGQILFNGQATAEMRACEVASLGVIRTFQNIRLFNNLSVLDNILLPMHGRGDYSLWSAAMLGKAFQIADASQRNEAFELLKIFRLESLAEQPAGSLPYGVQRKIEIVRALAAKPKLMLLDEPAAGMNDSETDELMRLIQHIRSTFGLSILLIEHDMKLVMGISQRIVVLDHGVVIADGRPEDVRANPKVIEAYLGVEETA